MFGHGHRQAGGESTIGVVLCGVVVITLEIYHHSRHYLYGTLGLTYYIIPLTSISTGYSFFLVL